MNQSTVTTSRRMELCRFCDHFVELNSCTTPGAAKYLHVEDDRYRLFEHNATPSGDIRTMEDWVRERPDLFFRYEDESGEIVGPNFYKHVHLGPGWKLVPCGNVVVDEDDAAAMKTYRAVRKYDTGIWVGAKVRWNGRMDASTWLARAGEGTVVEFLSDPSVEARGFRMAVVLFGAGSEQVSTEFLEVA